MGVTIRSLSVLAYAQGFTLWHYKAASASLADVVSDGYFDPASDMLAIGDMMMISSSDGGRMVCVSQTRAIGAGKKVTVAPLT